MPAVVSAAEERRRPAVKRQARDDERSDRPGGALRLVDGRWLYRQVSEIPADERGLHDLTAMVTDPRLAGA